MKVSYLTKNISEKCNTRFFNKICFNGTSLKNLITFYQVLYNITFTITLKKGGKYIFFLKLQVGYIKKK